MQRIIIISAVALALLGLSASAEAIDAGALLKKTERIRNPQRDYSVTVVLKDRSKGKSDLRTFRTLIKGRDKALVKFRKPEIDAGKEVLMVDREMWIYMPKTAKPIRISPRQKLAGNAAYGDIARLNFSGNYSAEFLKKTTYKKQTAIILELRAKKDRPVTYALIEYWIEEGTNRPIKAEFKTQAGKTLKTGYFERYRKVFGVMRPTVLRLVDRLRKGHTTILTFKNARKESLPEIMFEKQNLGRS